MFIVIRHMTKAFGMFKTEDEALQYGMGQWEDTNFNVISLVEALDDLGLDFKEV